MTLRDNQTKNTLVRDKPIGKYKRVAAKDYHPDCRADLTQIVALHTREQFVNQRTDLVNALRSHLYEFGYSAPQGIQYLSRLAEVVEEEGTALPDPARYACRLLLEQISALTAQIKSLQNKVAEVSVKTGISRQLQTMPGVGPIGALAIETFAPPMDQFRRGRDFAAWLGLVPRQHSSGGKQVLGKVTKMGQRDIRRLLISGAMAVIVACKRFGKHQGTWVARMLEKKPPMLVAVALANKMARGIWAMITKGQDYQEPVAKVMA